MIGRLFGRARGGVKPPLDGIGPTFEMVGAAPTAALLRPPGSIVRHGTDYYWQAGTLAAPVWTEIADIGTAVAAALAASLNHEALIQAEAAAALGVTVGQLFGAYVAIGAVGAVRTSGGVVAPGVRSFNDDMSMRHSNGGGAGGASVQDISLGNTSAPAGTQNARHVRAGAERWWFGGEIRVNTAVAATGRAGLMVRETAQTELATRRMFLGVRGATDVNDFFLWGDVGTPMSIAPLDANYHKLTAWSDGVATRANIDNGAPVVGDARPSVSGAVGCEVTDSAANLITMDCRWIAAYAVKPGIL